METKVCTKCKEEKLLASFYNDKNKPDGHKPRCSTCSRVQAAAYRNKLENLGKTREYHLKSKYGITSDQYNKMYEDQCGLCAICHRAFDKTVLTMDGRASSLGVDHNHKTGQVRGLLCPNCNRGLGMFADSIESMYNAISYLMTFENILEGGNNYGINQCIP